MGTCKLKCKFCNRPADGYCTHKLEDARIVDPRLVKPGDWIQDISLRYCLVVAVAEGELFTRPGEWPRIAPVNRAIHVVENFFSDRRAGPPRWIMLTIEDVVALSRIHVRAINPGLPMLRMESIACGKPVCDMHSREPDEGLRQCPDHWDVEAVYAAG